MTAPDAPAHARRPPDLSPGARIVVVRHGATALSGRVLNGGSATAADPPLTPVARAQVMRTGELLRELGLVDDSAAVRCSPALRARETAAAMGWPAAPVDPRLAEAGLGAWEGAPAGSAPQGEAAAWLADADFAPAGGESMGSVVARVAPAVAECRSGATTVLVSHHGTMLAVLMAVLGLDLPAARRLALPPGSAMALRSWADGGASLDALVAPPAGTIGE